MALVFQMSIFYLPVNRDTAGCAALQITQRAERLGHSGRGAERGVGSGPGRCQKPKSGGVCCLPDPAPPGG